MSNGPSRDTAAKPSNCARSSSRRAKCLRLLTNLLCSCSSRASASAAPFAVLFAARAHGVYLPKVHALASVAPGHNSAGESELTVMSQSPPCPAVGRTHAEREDECARRTVSGHMGVRARQLVNHPSNTMPHCLRSGTLLTWSGAIALQTARQDEGTRGARPDLPQCGGGLPTPGPRLYLRPPARGEKRTKFYCGKLPRDVPGPGFFKMCGVDSCIFLCFTTAERLL